MSDIGKLKEFRSCLISNLEGSTGVDTICKLLDMIRQVNLILQYM